MVVAVPVLWLLMPWLMRIAYGAEYREHATDGRAARADRRGAAVRSGAGRSRSRSRSAGRGCATSRSASRSAIFVPLMLVFGAEWGATGGAAAMVVSTAAFCVLWVVLLARRARRAPATGALAS